MNKIVTAVLVAVLLVGGYLYLKPADTTGDAQTAATPTDEQLAAVAAAVPAAVPTTVREFAMQSWMENKSGTMSAHFSLNEIRVKRGDLVRITITNTAGIHDFTIDGLGIKKETPLSQPVVVEFVADKVGTFEYYCSKYNHRQLGQKGNLIIEP